MAAETPPPRFKLDRTDDGGAELRLAGPLSAFTIDKIWRELHEEVKKSPPKQLRVDASEVTLLDGAGAGLLVSLQLKVENRGGEFSLLGLPEHFQRLLNLFDVEALRQPPTSKPPRTSFFDDLGRATWEVVHDLREQVAFVGELTWELILSVFHPRQVRWSDTFRTAETAGVNALPIVLLIGFLLGLIMAFQAAVPMMRFGAEIYVADLVSLAMLRELGPLMTAIVLAGRSGSAFAAEIGTMKVNEEINALITFGLDPVRFLVVPRVLAAVLMMPILTAFANLAGLTGGALVMLSLDFPLVTYLDQVNGAISMDDYMGGMVKAFFFGILVAAVGCLRGLQTRAGASAVGASTTRSVVSAIVLIAIADGLFSVVYYFLGF